MRRHLAKFFGSAAFALAMALLPTAGAHALTISPPYFDFKLNPGDTVLDVIKLYNESPLTELKVWPVVQNFTNANDEGGTPSFYPADENKKGQALAPWIKVSPDPIVIPPLGRANVPYSINIPKEGAQPGGHFGAVMLSLQPPDVTEGIGLGSQIAALMLVNVSGDAKELASLTEFGFKKPQAWYNYLPVDFFLRFENDGNTHLRPTGNLFIKDFMGRTVETIVVNGDYRSVLPQSIRRFEFGWQHYANEASWSELKKEWMNFAFGKYTATLFLTYGEKNQILTEERVFYVWPWRLILIAVIALILIILIVIGLGRSWKKSVIKQYERKRSGSDKK